MYYSKFETCANGGVVMWLSEETRRQRYTRLLLTKMQELQREPTPAEMRSDPRMPDPNDYAFYWRSFSEAVKEIGLQAKRQFAEKGGEFMAKTKKEWPHTASELLDLAVAKCMEMDRMPSRRAWMRDQFLDFEELVEVLGKGDWRRAEMKIALAWDNRKGRAEKAAEQKAEKQEVAKQPVKTVEVVEPPKGEMVQQQEEKEQMENAVEQQAPVKATEDGGRRGKRYSLEELKVNMVRIQEHFGITMIPSQVQINQAAREIGTPSYTAFVHGFGPKPGWAAVMAGEEPQVDQKPKVEEPQGLQTPEVVPKADEVQELAEAPGAEEVPVTEVTPVLEAEPQPEDIPVVELVICAAQFDVIWQGQKMQLKVKFG